MKNTLDVLAGLIAFITTVVVIAAVAGFYFVTKEYHKPGPLRSSVEFQIQSGQSAIATADMLQDIGAIENANFFIYALRILGEDQNIKAGEYRIEPHASMRDITVLLSDGRTLRRYIGLAEGITSYEIVQKIRQVDLLEGEIKDIPPEGSLLPNTYAYQRGDKREKILERMSARMRDVVLDLCEGGEEENSDPQENKDDAEATNMRSENKRSENKRFEDYAAQACNHPQLKTVRDVLTLASIVEKETGIESERKIVARLFLNRLKKNMALQTDPTVIYALTEGRPENKGMGPLGRRLLRKDLEIDSPYNTYKYPGLPPGPICNPGEASIRAVFDPADHKYLYMVADGTGGHAFATTLDDHNANVSKWRKIRAAQ